MCEIKPVKVVDKNGEVSYYGPVYRDNSIGQGRITENEYNILMNFNKRTLVR